MRFRTLGGLEIADGTRPNEPMSPKQRAVLAVLLVDLDRVVSADRLIDIVWDDPTDAALPTLQSHISRLRTILEPDRLPRHAPRALVTQPPGYRLVADRADVDAYRFEDDVTNGLALLAAGSDAAAIQVLRAALDDWTGPFLPEFADRPFASGPSARLERARLAALEGAADAHVRLGAHIEAARLLEGEAREHPDRERMQWLMALALYRSDRQTEALRVIDQCRRALVDTSGLSIGVELRELEAAILSHDPSLAPPQTATTATATTAARATTAKPPPSSGATPEPTAASPTALIGRAQETAALDDAVRAAQAGHGGCVLIVGEPGIGKTRLAESAVERAADLGVVTAWARCPENRSSPPFWPLTQLGEQLRASGFTDLQVRELDRQGAEVAVSERFGFYRAVLRAVAAIDTPMLLVIDDLQWADPDSLRLLEHLASELRTTRTLLVATLRPTAEETSPALDDCLSELTRVAGSVQILLHGLHPDDVATWLDERTDVDVPQPIAELVHERTAGNPLFIKEVVELLAAEGRLGSLDAAREARAIPPGVKAVVRRRVSRLPSDTQQLLLAAAVLGRIVDIDSLSAVVTSDTATVLTTLEPAVELGLLVEHRGELNFSHVLVADALADEVNAVRRAAFHAAAARALAAEAGPGYGLRAAAVAHHAFEGILAGTGELAIDAGSRSAALASEQFAYEDAAAHWARVVEALERSRPSDPATRIDALVAQAAALLRADMIMAAKQPIIAAVDAAAAVGSVADMVRAAMLVNHEHVWANEPYGVVDAGIVRVLERTLAALDDDPDGRAMLLGALAAELAFADRDRHLDVCAAAERAARMAGRPTTLAVVLNSITVPCRPSQIDQRRAWALEILELATTEHLDADQRFAAHYHLAETCVERLDFAGAEVELGAARRAIESAPSDRLRSQLCGFEGALAITRGRYEESAELIHVAQELHRRGRRYDADALRLANDTAVALDRGGLEGLIPVAAAIAETSSYGRNVAETMAFAMLELGRSELAAGLIERYGASHDFPDDYMTLCCISAALHVRVELGDRVGAAAAARSLEPFPHRWAGAGTTPLSMGPTDLALARYAAFDNDQQTARARFADAVRSTEVGGAHAWLARCLVHQGGFLIGLGELDEGRDALRRADELATRYALPYVQRRLRAFTS